ncbi:MAG TPA: putative LPS assembly protein LptD [Vicinamibacterales bacterium]|nr:putative LPS assembly protein LptD [Vicinamibacterales bacterium]
MLRSLFVAGAALAVMLAAAPDARAQGNPFSDCSSTDYARSLSSIPTPIPDRPGAKRWTLTGTMALPVVITCTDTVLQATQIVYDDDTRDIHATGSVVLQQPDFTVFADHADMNGKTRLGTFYTASGFARIGDQPAKKSPMGTLESDFKFHADRIDKTGPKSYRLYHGAFTTCAQPTPRWEMSGSNGSIVLDRHAILRNVVLRVKDVPLLYLPAIYYPINKEDRSTGFLLPTYGSSTLKGSSLSNAFFLAINRSQDATFYHDWFAKTGQGLGTQYRYVASPGSRGTMNFYLLDEHEQLADNGVTVQAPAHRSYRIDGDMNQGLPGNFRAIGRVNFFTDVTAQQNYQNVYDYSSRTRSFSGSVGGNIGRYRINVSTDQTDYFYGATSGQRSGHEPVIDVSMSDTPIGHSPIYVGLSGQAGYLIRQDDLSKPDTNRSLWRFDAGPSVRAPVGSLPYLTVTTSASWRITRWLESYDPATAEVVPVALTRQLFDMRAQIVGPVFSRIFQPSGSRVKHIIQPAFTIERTSSFADFDRVIQNDGVDTQVGGTTRVDYRLTNRLLVKKAPPPGSASTSAAASSAREVLTVDVGQTYYSNALAANYDTQYQSSTASPTAPPGTFSPVQITASTRPTQTASAQFRMEIDSKYRAIRTLNASGSLQNDRAQVTAGWSKREVIPGLAGFDDPNYASHFINADVTVHTRDNHVGGTYAFNFDMHARGFLQQRILAYYNSQCCGVSIDYQSISTPLLSVPSDRRFGISFTLAGIGSFANPLGSFGGGR